MQGWRSAPWLAPGPGWERGANLGPGHALTVHEIKDEAELVRRVEGVRHADDERAVLGGHGRGVSAAAPGSEPKAAAVTGQGPPGSPQC